METKSLKVTRKLLDIRKNKKTDYLYWDKEEKKLGKGLHELTCTVSGSKKLVLVESIQLPETEKDVQKIDKADVLRFVRTGIEAVELGNMGARLDTEIAKRRISVAIANGNTTVAQEIIEDIEKSLVPMLERIGQEITAETKAAYVQNTYGVDYNAVVGILEG